MTGGYMFLALARHSDKVLSGGLVTAASISLIVASILWVVLSRLVLRNLRKGAHVPVASVKTSADVWKEPPSSPPS